MLRNNSKDNSILEGYTTCKGVQKTHRPAKPDPIRPDPTQPAGLGWFLRLGGLGWITKKNFIAGQVGFGS